MSTILDRFIGQRQQTRQAQSQTHWARYKQLLERFASGAEVDSTEADLILEQAGKSEADLQRDVQTMEQRIHWRRLLDARPAALADMDAAQGALDRLSAERVAFLSNWQAKVDAANLEFQNAQQSVMESNLVDQKLRESALVDPQQLEREHEIAVRLRELVPQQRELADEIKQLGLPIIEHNLEFHKKAYKDVGHSQQRIATAKIVDKLSSEVEHKRAIAVRLQSELDGITAEMSLLNAERDAIGRTKLKP